MRKRPGRGVVVCAGIIVLALGAPMLFGQRMFEGFKSRIYTGLVFSYSNISGKSFDGGSAFEAETEFIPIPELNASTGLGIVLGLRGEAIGVELSYFYNRHGGTVVDLTPQYQGPRPDKFTLHVANIDFKGHFWPASRLEGYYQVGLATAFLSVKKAIFGIEGSEYKVEGDATFQGAGINFGLGLDFWITRLIGLTVGAFYRPLFFTTIKENLYGADQTLGTYDIDISGIKGHGLGIQAGILVNLK